MGCIASVVSRKFVEQIPSVGSALRSSGENGCRLGAARSRVGRCGASVRDSCTAQQRHCRASPGSLRRPDGYARHPASTATTHAVVSRLNFFHEFAGHHTRPCATLELLLPEHHSSILV